MEVCGLLGFLKGGVALAYVPLKGERFASIEERGPFILFLADRARYYA